MYLLEIQVGLLSLQPLMGLLVGLLLGHRSHTSTHLEFDSFSATRPVSDRMLAAIFLRGAWWSVCAAYLVSVFGSLATAAWAYGKEPAGVQQLIEQHLLLGGWRSMPLACVAPLLATWAAVGLSGSIVLTGRSSLVVFVLGGAAGVLVTAIAIINLLVPPNVGDVLSAGCWGTLGLACLTGTAWAFVRARRQGLASSACVWRSALGWLLLCGFVWFALAPSHPSSPLSWLAWPLVPGLLALCVSPLATAPLALAWNRHR
jgi:hypothetical protein